YGVTLEIRGSQACASKDTIVLPVLPEDDHRAAILARGYLDHEAGHIKHTEMEIKKIGNPLGDSLLNTLEDIRIEQAMGRRYPGCRQNLHKLVELLVADGDFKPLKSTDPPAAVIHGYLLHMLRARILGQQALEPLANQDAAIFDRTFPGMRARLDPLALEVANAPNTWAVREIVEKILRLLQDLSEGCSPDGNDREQQPGNDREQQPRQSQGESDAGPNSGPDEQDDGDAGQSSFPSPDAQTDPNGQENAGNDREQQDAQSQSKKQGGDNAEQQDEPEAQNDGDAEQNGRPEAQGESDAGQSLPGRCESGGQKPADSAVQAAAEALADDTPYQDFGQAIAGKLKAISKGHRNSPGIGIAKEVPPWWEPGCRQLTESEIMAATARLRAMLGGLVQAKRACRTRPSLAGTKLNLRGLPRMAANDGRVFLARQERQAVNTAVYLLLDQSGSMKNKRVVAFQATVALARGLRAIPGTAVAVGSFTTFENDVPVVVPLLRFEQPERRLTKAVPPNWLNTPMAQSIYSAAAQLLRRREPRKILVCITDGDPDEWKMTRESIDRCRASGIEVYGVGIMHDRVKGLFGKRDSVVIDQLSELPDKLFKLLAKRL
ncbi:MAG: VWA domain-containing protein, partial [Deltaproteobacteria bacterium]|nr:VWA domain-containing protein [Deltaproteobacteria bacterium]